MYYAWHPVRLPCSPAEAAGPDDGGGGGGGGVARGGQIRWQLQRRAAQPVLREASQQLELHRQWRQQHGQPQAQAGNGGQAAPAGPAVGGVQLPQVLLSQSRWSEEVVDAVNAQGGLSMEEMVAYSEMSGGLVSGASGAASDVLLDALQREIGERKRLQRELLRYQLQEQAQQAQRAQRAQQPQQAPPQQRQQHQAQPPQQRQQRQAQPPQQAAAPQHRQQRQAQQQQQQQLAPQPRQQLQAQQQQPGVPPQQPRPAQQPQQARRRPDAGAAAAAAAGGGGHRPRQAPRPPGGLQQPRQHARQQAQQQPRRQHREHWQGQAGLPPQLDGWQGGGEASGMTDAPEPQAPQQRAAVARSLACTAGGPDASDLQPPAHAGKRGRQADSQAERQQRRLRQHPQPQRSEEGSADVQSRQGSAGSTPARQREPFARAGSSEQELAVSCAVGGGSHSAAIVCEEPVPLVAAEAAAELEAAEAASVAAEAAAQRRAAAATEAASEADVQRETAVAGAEVEAEDATEAAAAAEGAAAKLASKQQARQRRSPRGLAVQQPAPAAVPDAQPNLASKATPAARRRTKAAAAAARPAAAAAAAAAEPAAVEAAAPAAAAAPANPREHSAQAEAAAAARAAAVADAEAALPPHPGDCPIFQGPGAGRLVSPEAWWQHKAAVQQWERQKRRREEGEAEVEAARAGKRRRQAGPPAPLVPSKPLLLPSVALGPAGDSAGGGKAAAKLLAEQRAALAAATAGRGRVRVPRAAAVVGAAKLAAHAAPRGRRGGRHRAAAGSAAAAQEEAEEEQQFLPADMAMLRLQAPLLQQHRSPLHGWGMFAGQAIPRDAFVIEYTGEVIPHSVADQREKRYEAEGTGTMYLFRLDSRSVIDATLKGGAARYINHSCDPNCYTLQLLDIHTGRRCIAIFAGREIAAGEELTYNYWMEEEPDGEPVPCHCGAPHCTGRMN